MITDWLIDLFQAAVSWLLGLVPSGWVPNGAEWPGRATELASKFSYAGYWLPFGVAATGAKAVLSVWFGLQVYSFVVWALRRLHVLG